MTWAQRFLTPIVMPDGCPLRTLQDAADYIVASPAFERETTAAGDLRCSVLILAAQREDYVPLARVVVLKALDALPAPPQPPKLRIVRSTIALAG
jgi:hypothetical protein